MEKEINLEAEKIESLRAELQIVMDELRTTKANNESPKASTIKSENEIMKKLLGGFHPNSDSPTYKELHDENQKLKKKNEELLAENSKLKQGIANRESEIQLLRSNNMPQEATTFTSSTIEESEGKSENEKRIEFRDMLIKKTYLFSDAQMNYLVDIFKEGQLPADALFQIANPKLTPEKMATLAMLMRAKYHLPDRKVTVTHTTEDSKDGESDEESALSIPLEIESSSADGSNSRLLKINNNYRKVKSRY